MGSPLEAVDTMVGAVPLWLAGPLLFALLWCCAWFGRWLRRRAGDPANGGDSGLIVSSTLGLLALLLGFTVSMAVSRYDARRSATVAEANTIGTLIYRADMLPPAARAAMLDGLKKYTESRIAVGRMRESAAAVEEARARSSSAAQSMWDGIMAVGPSVPDTAVRILIVESANQMFDAGVVRDASLANRLPPTLVVLLLLFPMASLVLVGYVRGEQSGAHLMASSELILLLTLVLLLIADLNRPRSGTIAIPVQPLVDAARQAEGAMRRGSAVPPVAPISAPAIGR